MAINNYGTLKTAVANFLERDDLTNRIPEFISLAEDRIYLTLRIREMENSATITTTAAQQTDALPTRFIGARRLYVDASPDTVLEYRSTVNFWSIFGSQTTASPTVFTIEGEDFVWAPIPDSAYSIKVLYYNRLAAFSSDTDTNALLTKARGLYLYGALLEAAPFLDNDPRILTWAQFFDDLKERVESSDKRDRFSGYPLTQRDLVQVT